MKFLLLLPVYYAIACFTLPFITTLFIPTNTPNSDDTETQKSVTVLNIADNTTSVMNMEDYLVGVVAAEMPAAFESEALKAQAVAARTYTIYKSSSSDHEADVCTDFAHCQAYLTEGEMLTNWGSDFDFYHNKIRNAVYSTQGEYLTYNDEPIMAVFHSMGGGQTQNSGDVWGNQLPYLQSVPSPGEEEATGYHSTVTLPFEEFKNIVLSKYPSAQINSYLDISQPTRTASGHVKSIIIGSVTVSGAEMRTLFNLRSTRFDLTFFSDNITFNVTGYGHGVVMSQYGANAMAKSGSGYAEILSHYYQGATLTE